ncbi:unnamed protein product [Brassicogethes aeneus]|uniref:Uncharacterized protein n=1 Tax=Brassicogethes aeneus TaxID=1431903 RepID=A0A9P0ATZ6_BRAAE|nr:unnamed protein product [Brassicogethes aeneus]
MDSDAVLNEKNSKKGGRHRKKQLYNSILQQMEFYFSTSNLSKDRFLSQLISEDPYIELSVFLSFNKLKKLTENIEDIQKALSKSELIELSEDKLKVKRKTPLKVKENVDECTIYVENIKSEADHDWVKTVFSEFGNVVYISIPKYKQSKANKGFAFVEFETESEAQSALQYFENIGCKMPSHVNPEELKSIATFEGPDQNAGEIENDENNAKKRKFSENECPPEKKLKTDDAEREKITETEKNTESEKVTGENENKKKKKLKKECKKKHYFKELGLQILSKKEWKKMRNKYLDLQKKKMKEFKQYLNRNRFSQRTFKKTENLEIIENEETGLATKLEYQPGLIVKVKLPEVCDDLKKLKNEIKSQSTEIKYVDMPVSIQEPEVFVRFGDAKSAAEFCQNGKSIGEKILLKDEEEKQYWDKINNDRSIKFSKCTKKQRGRDKLMKKAAKEVANHIRFDETDVM